MLYFDTSFITPLIRDEASSESVRRFMAKLPEDDLAVSHWTKVEFASVLARNVRMGGISKDVAGAALSRFEALLSTSFTIVSPAVADFVLATQFVGTFLTGLRGGDALHLAIARNNLATAIYTLDKGLLTAGQTLGLPMSSGIAQA
jgi:predicted nucleic acid-binding protein